MVNRIHRDQDCLLIPEDLLNDLLQGCGILLKQQPILLPREGRVGEEDIDLIGQDRASSRTILALCRSHRATAEGVAQLIAQFFQQTSVNRVWQVRNEKLNAYLF